MHLIDNRQRRWLAERFIAFPVVCQRIDHDALHRSCSIVASPACSPSVVVFGHNHAASIRIEKNLVRIEAETAVRVEWTVDSISVELSGLNAGHKYMPIMICAVGKRIDTYHLRRLRIVFPVEEQQLDSCSLAGEDAKVHALAGDRGPERI